MHPELGQPGLCKEILGVECVLVGKFHNHNVVT